jgi:hypothetical protein
MNHTIAFIDCEFNGFGGDLISMAIVAPSGDEFYEVIECKKPAPWVLENVMPVLNKQTITIDLFKKRLGNWIGKYDSIYLIADWPDDIRYFCQSVILSPGQSMKLPTVMKMQIIGVDIESKIPHNALSDAKAIMQAVYSDANANHQS